MKQLTSTKLRVLQSLPKHEPVNIRGSNRYQYDYGYKKSWGRFYSIAYSFINRCSETYEGKPTHQLINALRKGCTTKYKHRAFKKCIEDYIHNCLVTNTYKNKCYQENFVSINGIVTRNTYKRLDTISLWFENRKRTKDEYLYLPYGVLVIRYQGLHYFITAKEVLNDPSRLYSHFNIPSQYYLPQILSKEKFKLLYPVKLKQHDLEQYGLVDQFALVKLKDKANND